MKKEDKKAEVVQKFFEKQVKFKEEQAQFNKLKAQFNSDMEDFFKQEGIQKSITFSYDDEIAKRELIVSRVQKVNIEFDANKLEKVLDKKLGKQVIVKQYEIVDIDALIAYLKECNVDPKIFKSFLNISKSVNTQELDRLEEIGKITAKQVEGCYKIKCQNPYFTVGVKRGHNDGEQKW